jgi:hypothetical protein
MRLRTWLAVVFIAIFGLAVAFQSRSTPAFAQLDTLEFDVATPGIEETPATSVPNATPSEIEAATNRYFAAVEAYRLEENRYGLARDQYYQLNTLAALDEAIRRGREVLRARAEVLNAYFSYLRLILQNTKGIDLTDKAAADEELQAWQTKLEGYVEEIPQVSDRVQLNTAFAKLNDESRTVKSTAYGTLVLIKIGEIQTAADTARILQERTTEAVKNATTLSAAQVEISTRGLNEISLLLQRANNNTFTLLEDYREQKTRGDFTESGYRNFQSNAEFSYLELRQVVDYLREIQKTL